jgi:hypothetical protein
MPTTPEIEIRITNPAKSKTYTSEIVAPAIDGRAFAFLSRLGEDE